MYIDGEKWACESCVKGHRVSGCNHSDRELQHINKKGRPVKQCEHCRGARKSKSHHGKCDCGDKKDKAKQKAKGDVAAHDGRCQCHSGAKCICGTTKDPLNLKVETGRQTLHDARAKPKLMQTQSESHLTIFANGHHKPCHRNNNTAHVSGAPYKIPRPHTLHGHAAFAALAQNTPTYAKPEVPQTRAMDTHSLSNNDYHTMFGSTQQCSVDNLFGQNTDYNQFPKQMQEFQDSLFAGQNGFFSRGDNSPSSRSETTGSSQQWAWTAATTATPVNNAFAYSSLSTSPSQDCLSTMDNDWGLSSAGFNPLWSAGDLPLDPTKFSDSLAQPISHSGESKQSGPGLTAASSVHSEIGEPILFGDLDMKATQSSASESLFWEDSPVYGINASAPGTTGLSAVSTASLTSMPGVPNLEPTFPKSMDTTSAPTVTSAPANFAETAAIAMPSFGDVVPVDPWSMDQNNAPFGAMGGFDLTYGDNWF